MSKIKKGDVIKCLVSRDDNFMAGCEYQVDKVDSNGYVFCYNDYGEQCAIDYPVCPEYGTFKKVD